MAKITYIDDVILKNKKILLRVDFNVSLNKESSVIEDDTRIKQTLPTLKYLLKNNNQLILITHLGKPKVRDPKLSLRVVANRLQEYFPKYKVILVNDFLTKNEINDDLKNIYLIENIRFYPGEKKNDPHFAKQLAKLADCYVNDGFGVSHRSDASVVGVTQFLPSYGGLLLKNEVEMINQVITKPKRPFVAIIGGAKISTKIGLIEKLMELTDWLIIGGAMANTFWKAQGLEIGKSLYEKEFVSQSKTLLQKAEKIKKPLILPEDAVIGCIDDCHCSCNGAIKQRVNINKDDCILDIGPQSAKKFAKIIAKAKTIIWNGPVGYFENPKFAKGTDAIYKAVVNNKKAISVVGGGDTLTAIAKKKQNKYISHISTGGGAMLELIEKGTLPGIEVLKH